MCSAVGVDGRDGFGVLLEIGVTGAEGAGVTGNFSLVGSINVKYTPIPFERVTNRRSQYSKSARSPGEKRPHTMSRLSSR